MPHFPQRFGFDLADSFTSNPKLAPHLFQGSAITINQTKSLLEHLSFTLGQRLEDILDLLLEKSNRGHIARILSAFIFNKISEIRLFTFANRRLEGDWLLRHL